jgi:hypothetical protein
MVWCDDGFLSDSLDVRTYTRGIPQIRWNGAGFAEGKCTSNYVGLSWIRMYFPETEGIENANNVLVPAPRQFVDHLWPQFFDIYPRSNSKWRFWPMHEPSFVQGTNDLLSRFAKATYSSYLLLNASTPSRCHSPDDKIVSFRNVHQDFLENPMVSYQNTSGMHACISRAFLKRCIDDLCLDGI